jgi:hypothetical protein
VEIDQSSIVSFIECANCRKILVADHAGGIHDVIAMIKIVPGGDANSRGGPIQINRVTRTKFLRRPKHYLRQSSFIRIVIFVFGLFPFSEHRKKG